MVVYFVLCENSRHITRTISSASVCVCVCVCLCVSAHTQAFYRYRIARLVVNFCLSLSLSPSLSLSLSLCSVTYSTISCVSSGHIGCFDLAHHPTLSCHAQRMLYPDKYIMYILSNELVGLTKYIAEPVSEYIVRSTVF